MLTLFDQGQLFDIGKRKSTDFDIPDADLTLHEQFFDKNFADNAYNTLLNETPWKQGERKMYDKIVQDPRLCAWYGKKEGIGFTPELSRIKEKVEAGCNREFDSVLLNLYRDGNDSVSWHSDQKPPGQNPPIASVSFGETRLFRIRHKFRKDVQPVDIPLTHGSFLLMAGTMQDYWEHHIPKTKKIIAPRINLTFRVTG